MSIEKNNYPETGKTTTAIVRTQNHFIKYVFWGIFLVIVILGIIALSKIRKLQEQNVKQKVMYENRLDSLHLADMTTVAKTFSWAVRSDLLRNNKDQAQLHLDNIMKEPHVQKAYVIDDTGRIILSTDSKEVGIVYPRFTVIDTRESKFLKSGNVTQLISPMMSLNKKLGLAVIEITTDK